MSTILAAIANIAAWLSSKKTKHAITASLPLVLAGLTGEMSWFQVAVGLAGVWTTAMGAQAVADVGKERAKIEALARAYVAGLPDERATADAITAEVERDRS